MTHIGTRHIGIAERENRHVPRQARPALGAFIGEFVAVKHGLILRGTLVCNRTRQNPSSAIITLSKITELQLLSF